MKILALTITAFLLLIGTQLLTGCAPMPYQGCCDPCDDVVIIYEPYPPPHYPPVEYPLPRLPAPDRRIPLTKDQAVGNDQPRTKEPPRGRPPRRPVTKPSRKRAEPDPVQISKRTPRDPLNRTPRTR